MSRISAEIGFYGILTDPVVGYEHLTEVMVEQGLAIIQLRMKNTAEAEVLDQARRLRRIIPASTAFVVNDFPRVAAEVGADGVHLGQDDAPYAEARALLGPEALIGLSTHNPEQTRAACALGPDYIGVGPVHATPTKQDPDPVIGLEGMRAMLDVATVPAVVLGGIDHGNVDDVLAAGARNVCAVRCINQSPDPAAELERMKRAIARRS
jgi:thiamine-phosphate pyrophosphorylase